MSNTLKLLAANIVQLREKQNLTQEQLSEKAQISLAELQIIENADPQFHMLEFFKLGETLKFNPIKLLSQCEKSRKTQINKIKKQLETASDEFLIDIENFIKNKNKNK